MKKSFISKIPDKKLTKKIIQYFLFISCSLILSKAVAVNYVNPAPQATTIHLMAGPPPDTFTETTGNTYFATTAGTTSIQADGSTTITNSGTITGGNVTPSQGGVAIVSSTVLPTSPVNITNSGIINNGVTPFVLAFFAIQSRDNTTAPGTYSPFSIQNSGTITGISLFSNVAANQGTIINNVAGGNIVGSAGQAIQLGAVGEISNLQTVTVNNASGATIQNAAAATQAILTNFGSTGTTTATINNNGMIIGNIENASVDPNFKYIVNAGNGSTQGIYISTNTASTLNQFNVVAGAGGQFTLVNNITNINRIEVKSGTFNAPTASITGFTTFLIDAGTTLNQSGTTITGAAGVGSLTNNGTYSLSGGSLNVNSLTNNGTMSATGGTLTAPTFLNTGSFTQGINITANLNNTGTHFVPTAGGITTRAITGNYTTSGTFSPSIVSTTNFGQITATTANVSGAINVILPNGTGALHPGDTFNVIITPSAAALNYNLNTVITPFFFRLVPSALALGIVELEVAPFEVLNTNPLLACIASSLDTIALNPPTANLNALIQALFNVPNFAAFESALESLLPSVEQGLIINTVSLDQLLLDHITDRLDLMRAGVDLVARGYAAGDIGGGQGSYGPLFYAGSIQQDDEGFFRGYTATTAGVAIVGDTSVRCYGKLGIGISASNTVIKPGFGNASFGNNINFYSVQPLIYGSLDYCGLFIDAFAGIAYNQYRTIRNISFINETANGKFYGVQTNGQARVGAIIAISTLQFTPIASFRYAHLRQQAYTETGAPLANLSIAGTKSTLTQGAYGLKIMEVSDPDFFPELHAYYISDIKRPNLLVRAQFAQGGPFCQDQGLLPARNGVDIGGSLSFLFQQMLVTIDGDVELRKKFTGYSGWLRARWLF